MIIPGNSHVENTLQNSKLINSYEDTSQILYGQYEYKWRFLNIKEKMQFI